jgi:hypothetical protein
MRRIIFIVVLVYISGCDADDEKTNPEPAQEQFYTIEVAADFKTTDTDDWVLASDPSGKWLDVQRYEAGQTIQLIASPPISEAINLTFLSVQTFASGPWFNFKTYTEMPVNGTWTIKPIVPTPLVSTLMGDATIKVENFNGDFLDIKISSLQGNRSHSSTLEGSKLIMNVSLLNNPTNLVFSYREGDDYKSTVIKNVTPGSIVTIDALDIDPPEKSYRFSFPNNTFYYIGFYGYNPGDDPRNTGYIISEHIDNNGGAPGLLLGYNTGYEKYKSIVSYGAANYHHTYYKFGTPMEDYPDFSNPSPTHSGTLKHFVWNPDLTFSQSSAFFTDLSTKRVNWEIISKGKQGDDLDVSMEQFPSQLRDIYTSLNIDDITFLQGTAVLYLDEFTYQDFINVKSNSGNPIKNYSDEYYGYDWSVK